MTTTLADHDTYLRNYRLGTDAHKRYVTDPTAEPTLPADALEREAFIDGWNGHGKELKALWNALRKAVAR